MFVFGDRHKKIKALLSTYLDDELIEKEKDLVDRHLATCGSCRQEMDSLRVTVDLIKKMPLVSPGRSFLLDQAENKLRPLPPPPIWHPVPVPVIITVLLTVALFLGDILHALPYSEKRFASFAPSASAPMVAAQSRPETASVISLTPSPVPEPHVLNLIPEATKADSSGDADGGTAPARTPGILAAPGAARAVGPAGVAGQVVPTPDASKSAPPASTTPSLPQGQSTLVAGESAAEARTQHQTTTAPTPVPQAPAPQIQAVEPSKNTGHSVSKEETTRGNTPASGSKGNFFIIPWRLIEIILIILSVTIITITIIRRIKRHKEVNSF